MPSRADTAGLYQQFYCFLIPCKEGGKEIVHSHQEHSIFVGLFYFQSKILHMLNYFPFIYFLCIRNIEENTCFVFIKLLSAGF